MHDHQVATVQPLSAEAVEAMVAATHALPVKTVYTRTNDDQQYFKQHTVAGGHGTSRHAKQAMAAIAADYAAQQAAAAGVGNTAGSNGGNSAGAGHGIDHRGTLYREGYNGVAVATSPDAQVQVGQNGAAGYYWAPPPQQMGMPSQLYVARTHRTIPTRLPTRRPPPLHTLYLSTYTMQSCTTGLATTRRTPFPRLPGMPPTSSRLLQFGVVRPLLFGCCGLSERSLVLQPQSQR